MKNIHLQETVETPEEEVKQPAAEEPVETKEAAPEEEKQTEEEPKNNYIIIPTSSGASDSDTKIRAVGLIGDLDEERASEILYGMLSLQKTGTKEKAKNPEDPECTETVTYFEPYEMIISTHGGSASDMFGIYDMMRKHQSDGFEIHTFGLGKVMSAGVLLMAAGTKGKRRIGANTRVMIHAVAGGSQGAIHNLETEMDEIRWIQEQYIDKLVEETAMSKKYLSNLLKKKVNVYLSAQEAIDLGIADEVV